MSRLTEKMDNEKLLEADIRYLTRNQDGIYAVLNKLGELEDLEEQGRLIITKYAKGQTVYEVDDETDEICEYEVASNDVWHDVTSDYCDPWNRLDSFREDSPLVFATKEEAEAKLKELQND